MKKKDKTGGWVTKNIKHLVFGICVAVVLLSAFASVASAGDTDDLFAKTAASDVKVGTWVEGHITEDTTWTLAGAPYLVTGDVFVDEGVILTIEPGVIVKFGGYMSIFVDGSLHAVGTNADKISFTSNKLSPEVDDWNTIKFQGDEDETFVMKYTQVKYGTHGVTISSIGDSLIETCEFYNNTKGIHVIGNSNTQIKSNTIKFNQIGISSEGEEVSDITIANNIISNNNKTGSPLDAHGIYLSADVTMRYVTITGNTIYSNGGSGIHLYASAYDHSYVKNVIIRGNTIYSNGGSGIYLYAYASILRSTLRSYIKHVTISDNTIYSNGGSGIYLSAYTYSSLYYYSTYSYIYNVTIIDNNVSSNGGDGIHLYAYAYSPSVSPYSYIYKVTITDNNVSSNGGDGIYLYAYAHSSHAYTYSYIYNITIIGNTIYSNEDSGIYLSSYAYSPLSNLYHCHPYAYIYNITIIGNTIYSNGNSGVYLYSHAQDDDYPYAYIYNITITGNTIYSNGDSGVYLYSHSYISYLYNVTITDNTISSNDKSGIEINSRTHYADVEFDIITHHNYVYSNNRGIFIYGGSKTHITNNSIHTNVLGVLYDRTTGNFASFNNIYQNEYGMNVTNGATVKAEQNYWGDPSGPYHVSMNPYGEGNPVNGDGADLDFIPFLTSPVEIGLLIASFTYSPQNPVVGEQITFDASSSYDPNGEIVSYEWGFGDGNITSTTEKIIHHSYTVAGNYDVTLTVTDNEGLTNSTKEIVKISEPLTLGKGIWIWKLSEAEGGNVSAIIERCENVGITWVAIKCGDGGYFWSQCTLSTIEQFQNAGIEVFGWQYVYGDDPIGEASVANQILDLGVDGFIIDAEAEYEGKPANAITYLEKIREEHSDSFIAYTPFPIIDYHTDFPYLEFGKYCDAVMPQDYWKEIGVTPEYMVEWMEEQWDKWHAIWEAGGYGDSIKPIIPLGQGWDVSGSEITRFCNLVHDHDYGGVSLWRYGTMTEENWEAYTGFAPTKTLVEITTDKYEYAAGETMLIELTLANPTEEWQNVNFLWRLDFPDYGLSFPIINNKSLWLPSGYEQTFPIPWELGNYGFSFNAAWYVVLYNTTTLEVISEDTADWGYVTSEMAKGEIMPEEIAREITKEFVEIELPNQDAQK